MAGAAAAAAVAVASTVAYQQTAECAAGKLPAEGIVGTNTERTFIAIKPDGPAHTECNTNGGSARWRSWRN